MVLIIGLAYLSHMLLIIPMILLACIALFARHRYAYPNSDWQRWTGVLVGGYCLLLIYAWPVLITHPAQATPQQGAAATSPASTRPAGTLP